MFSNQITSFSKEKPKQTWFTSNTQTKTSLLDKEKSNKLCQMIVCFTSAMLQSRLYQVGIKQTKQKKKIVMNSVLCIIFQANFHR